MKQAENNERRAPMAAVLFASALLVCALGAFAIAARRDEAVADRPSLLSLLPKGADQGWEREMLPIADTPEMKARVSELLNYDDAVYAVYKRGRDRVSIYIAYWKPGRMPHRLVADHTPDVCWPLAGWTRVSRAKQRRAVGGASIVTEEGVFELNGTSEHVAFWHVVKDRLLTYDSAGRPPWYAFIRDVWEWGTDQRSEQWFFRISSDQPIEKVWTFSITQQALESAVPKHLTE
jgi:hypothetical protein